MKEILYILLDNYAEHEIGFMPGAVSTDAKGLGVQKDFNLHCLGSLTADLRCIDIFNTNKTDTVIFGYCDLTVHNPARRTFTLNLTWKFNEASSKYRGSGAGAKQKARM